MGLTQILIFILAATLAGALGRVAGGRWRVWVLLALSALAVYWLQPATPIRNLDFWLPTATLALAVWVWFATRQPATGKPAGEGEDWLAVGVLAGAALLVAATRYLGPLCCVIPTRPPELPLVLAGVALVALLAAGLARVSGKNWLLHALTLLLLGLFLALKTPAWAQTASAGLRDLAGQDVSLASALDIRWLGFSYVAFRLIHALRDRLTGRLPAISLAEFIVYILFFPSITAGPIDRVQRFSQDLRKPIVLDAAALWKSGERLLLGVFKKFALADTLALVALNAVNAAQVNSIGWAWVLLYAYAFRLYFDFSGYTDIAIGLGKLAGVNLPENFEHPYQKPNLTLFWNSWHITLAQWFRAYYFNPLTRAMRSAKRPWPMWAVILAGQATTMLLIGLWHGVTWNFAAWGLWHGLGLFVHNRWSEATRARLAVLNERPRLQQALNFLAGVFTFHYVALGWVWFALPTPALSMHVYALLFNF